MYKRRLFFRLTFHTTLFDKFVQKEKGTIVLLSLLGLHFLCVNLADVKINDYLNKQLAVFKLIQTFDNKPNPYERETTQNQR